MDEISHIIERYRLKFGAEEKPVSYRVLVDQVNKHLPEPMQYSNAVGWLWANKVRKPDYAVMSYLVDNATGDVQQMAIEILAVLNGEWEAVK